MSTKKLIKLLLALVVGYKCVEVFVWKTPIEIGPDTTYLSEPLADDGLPNYSQAIFDNRDRDVTLENNAAATVWQSLGPMDQSREDFANVCQSLGFSEAPKPPFLAGVSRKETLNRVAGWLKTTPSSVPRVQCERAAERLLELLYDTPWTEGHVTPLAAWVEENKGPLDLLVVAAGKPKYFSPPPNLITDPKVPAVDLLLPHAYTLREAIRSLSVRATLRVGNGDLNSAWDDCFACWRFGEHIGRCPSTAERLVGIAIRGRATRTTLAILDSPGLTPALAHKMLVDLDSLSDCIVMADALNVADRCMILDGALRTTKVRGGGVGFLEEYVRSPKYDMNSILRDCNRLYDRLHAMAAIEDQRQRREELAAITTELDSIRSQYKKPSVLTLLRRSARSKWMSDVLLSNVNTSSILGVVAAEDRDLMQWRMIRVSTALALFHARYGKYPENLNALVPAILPETPLDVFSGEKLVYERRDSGYLLYSVFENRIDDSGDDIGEPIVDGNWLALEARTKFKAPGMRDSDMVVRLPLPPLPSIEALIESQNSDGDE